MVLLNTLENHSTLQPKLFRNLLLPAAVLHVGQPLGFKQWGRLTTNNTGNITFPLSFSSFCAIALSTQSTYPKGAALSWSTYWTLNLDGFTCEAYDATYNAGKSYIAVGK